MDNSKTVGDATEARIVLAFVEAGYGVAVPFGDNDPYDLIVDSGDELLRIQCKTAWPISDRAIRFNTHSQTTKDGRYHETGYDGAVDAFVVYHREADTLYWIPIEDASSRKMQLRFSADIDHPSINWAADYELDGSVLRSPSSRE